MTSVRLVAISQPVIDECNTAEELIAFCARVSNPTNQANHDTSAKLLKYLADHQHWSPFEMVSLTVEINTTRDIARQILRHRSFSFQEFCITGDSLITFELPNGVANGKRAAFKREIGKLFENQQKGMKLPSLVRVFDERTRTFVTAPLKEVFQTGVKPIFEVELYNGKKLRCTKEHKFLTETGFIPLEEAIGLEMRGDTAVMTKPDIELACNGILAYQDKDWLSHAKARCIENKTGLAGIAELAECSYHTIRKWLKIHKLQFTKYETASYTQIWNRGVTGYALGPVSEETREKMRASAKKGSESNLWKGGSDRSERLKIADWCSANRSFFLKHANYECVNCKSSEKLELHHIKTVAEFPELAYEASNIQVLCRSCHKEIHRMNGDAKKWREKSNGRTLTVNWSKVKYVKFIGEEMTYDLEVDHDSHNYIANGIVVHNSQRYAAVQELPVIREARLQDLKNRQNSINTDDDDLQSWWEKSQLAASDIANAVYQEALDRGIAKEVARAVLPEGMTKSKIYMSGTLRSFLHYVMLRADVATQKEHRQVAECVQAILLEQFPSLSNLLE